MKARNCNGVIEKNGHLTSAPGSIAFVVDDRNDKALAGGRETNPEDERQLEDRGQDKLVEVFTQGATEAADVEEKPYSEADALREQAVQNSQLNSKSSGWNVELQ
jgi:hypothetical protein